MDAPATRRIAHLDMDAFYASVELLRRPELRGLPVVIGGRGPDPGTGPLMRLRDYVGRGVVTTSTYEARALGVFSAMGMMKAAALAPDAILLPADFPSYRHYSRLFKEAVARIAPRIEDRGIDEIYIDLRDLTQPSVPLAHAIKAAVREATGLVCSIGISPNKLLSKIASELDKPDGVTVIGPGDLERRIWPLPVRKVNGVGPKANQRLAAMGVQTIGELARAAPELLQDHFGPSYARWLIDMAHGIDERPVVTHSEPKSLSRETTFEHDLHVRHDRAQLSEVFVSLCARVAEDLRRKRLVGYTVGIKLRFADFSIVTRDQTLPDPLQDAQAIHRAAGQCLKRVTLDRRIRLLGVRVSSLRADGDDGPRPVQLDLY
ncbi:MAG: DNA polymerase IV [Alcaligenaceae bacterium]|nr:DNA polymerase IV [Alcaligenaceae bacterium]